MVISNNQPHLGIDCALGDYYSSIFTGFPDSALALDTIFHLLLPKLLPVMQIWTYYFPYQNSSVDPLHLSLYLNLGMINKAFHDLNSPYLFTLLSHHSCPYIWCSRSHWWKPITVWFLSIEIVETMPFQASCLSSWWTYCLTLKIPWLMTGLIILLKICLWS